MKKRIGLIIGLVLLVAMLVVPSILAAAPSYTTITGVYTIQGSLSAKYLGGTSHTSYRYNTLTITTQTNSTISAATLEWMGKDISLTGLVGTGSKPYVTLYGTDSDGTYVIVYGKITKSWWTGAITGMSGRVDGHVTSDGERWDNSGTGTAVFSTADYYSGNYSTLLTAGAGAGAECVQINRPVNSIKLNQLDTLSAGPLSYWFNLQDAETPGPQIGLRFAPVGVTGTDLFDSISHVDITIAAYQAYTGDGTWKQADITKDSAICFYYGNDPTDQTAFDGGTGGENYTLAEVEAAINAEAAMTAGSDSCSNWVLTAVYIDLYEAGARTCYVDDIKIGSITYTLEPTMIHSGFTAKKIS